MTSMTQSPIISKAFRSTVYDAPGILAKVNQVIFFFGDDGQVLEYEPEMAPWVCILGECLTAAVQNMHDRVAGGAAWLCTHRSQETR